MWKKKEKVLEMVILKVSLEHLKVQGFFLFKFQLFEL